MLKINLSEQKFGKLLVLKDVGRTKSGSVLWECLCDCGKTHIVSQGNLHSGNCRSCGCAERIGAFKDITGQRFGKLVAVTATSRRTKGGNVLWECLCDCGKTHVVSQGNLHTGSIRSCGCAERTGTWYYNDLAGQVFGRLTVLGIDHKSDHGMYWKCQCSCGNFAVVRSDGLVTGNTRSCGCLMLDMSKEKAKRLFTKHGMSGTKEYNSEKSRRRRDLQLVHDYLWTDEMTLLIKQLQPTCVICGMTDEEHLEKYGAHINIDHVLPLSKGHGLKPGNAVVLCQHHNGKKLARSLNDLPVEWQADLIWNAFQFKDSWERWVVA